MTSSALALQRQRHGQRERFAGLEIEHELELGRLHDRHVGGPRAFEDLADILAGLAAAT
jgi:hypothetical protein